MWARCLFNVPGCLCSSLSAEGLLDGRQETLQNAIHFGCDVGGGTRPFQLRSQHQRGALAYVSEQHTDVLLPDRLSAFKQSAALPYCFQLNRRKLRLDMIAQRREQHQCGSVNRFILGVGRHEIS
jgi:hypothetical protein